MLPRRVEAVDAFAVESATAAADGTASKTSTSDTMRWVAGYAFMMIRTPLALIGANSATTVGALPSAGEATGCGVSHPGAGVHTPSARRTSTCMVRAQLVVPSR